MFTVAVAASFCAVVLLAVSAALLWRERKLAARLSQFGAPLQRTDGPGLRYESGRAARLVSALSRLSAPHRGLHDSALRLRLAAAGLRSERAPLVFYALRTACTLLLPLLGALLLPGLAPGLPTMVLALLVVALAVAGYLLPDLYLRVRTAQRREAVREGLPDMVDLLLVCVESGLALDGAINRVSREIAARSPALAEELALVGTELRIGASRERALRNLATRTGVPEVGAFVAALLQADRFGTTIADSMRVHAEDLRLRRQYRAEEAAARIPTQLLFPLVLTIFPALFVVLVGPAAIGLVRQVLPMMGGTGG